MKTIAGALLWIGALAAQETQPSIDEVIKKHQETIRKIEGVIGITAGGTSDDPRIIVQVESGEAKGAVLKQVGKELDGYKVYVLVSAPVKKDPAPAEAPPPEKKPAMPTVAKEKIPPTERELLEDCDIIRDRLKMKVITHHKGGKTLFNCAVSLRQQIGGGGGHAYAYTKHREDCPLRLGKIKEPGEMDAFLKWVFRVGFSPALRGGFLGPYELKGSDTLWFAQVKEDLTSRLPYIREGAAWVEIKDDKAGVGWKWEVRK